MNIKLAGNFSFFFDYQPHSSNCWSTRDLCSHNIELQSPPSRESYRKETTLPLKILSVLHEKYYKQSHHEYFLCKKKIKWLTWRVEICFVSFTRSRLFLRFEPCFSTSGSFTFKKIKIKIATRHRCQVNKMIFKHYVYCVFDFYLHNFRFTQV